jgi:NADPH-dependent curcumin reductase CurA
MSKNINRQWLLATRPLGMVKETDFEYSETAIPTSNEGEFLVRNLYVSFDPAMRGWMMDRPSYIPPVQIGDVMRAGGVGQVVESRHPDFNPGDFVQGGFGWQDYIATSGADMMPVTKIPPGMSHTLPLSVLGLNGITAYFGLLDIGRPQDDETVVVSGAAGAPG